jgi:murein DD-endopeptidase MepM/ murein hydrolase activator NlpD
VLSITTQPTSGSELLTTVASQTGGTEAGGAVAPAPSLFAEENPLSGVLPGSVFDPLVAAALGADVPEFYLENFDVPPFLLPIYQSAAAAYDVPWEVLAAINEVETNFGNNLDVSSAGAIGWMQFLPSTWAKYGVDATGSGVADPYNAADAIFAAARYLAAAGAAENLPTAIFAYNHSNAYVQAVLLRAELLSGVPTALVNSVSGLAEGHFPIQLAYHPSYRPVSQALAAKASVPSKTGTPAGDAPALTTIRASVAAKGRGPQPGAAIFAKAHAAVVAVQDGTIVAIGRNRWLGTYVRLADNLGNIYTYGGLASVSAYYPLPKARPLSDTASLGTPSGLTSGPSPTTAASAGDQSSNALMATSAAMAAAQLDGSTQAQSDAVSIIPALDLRAAPLARTLVFALVSPPAHRAQVKLHPSVERTLVDRYYTSAFGLSRDQLKVKPLRVGSRVLAGTILGHLGSAQGDREPHLLFEIHPAGTDQTDIDPRPFLDAWTQLETLELHRQSNSSPLYGPDLHSSDAGESLLLSQIDLERTILENSHVVIALCERQAIADGSVDRRVLATIELLVQDGLDPTISGAQCAPPEGAATNSALADPGDSVTITAINGTPVAGNQGTGTTTDAAIRALLTLSGANAPASIASLETIPGATNTVADPSDSGQIVVSFTPAQLPIALASTAAFTGGFTLDKTSWSQLDNHLEQITEPRVPTVISSTALKTAVHKAASRQSHTR